MKYIIPFLFCLVPLVFGRGPVVADETRLNVVVLFVDDLGWTDLGCFGSDLYETPNIDRLAQQGMRFTSSYSACTVCSPTRAALMTGQYPARTHVTDFIPGHGIENTPLKMPEWTQKLEHRHLTIAEILREQGYRTAHVGKWHLTPRIRNGGPGSARSFPEYYPDTHGFDVNLGGNEGGAPGSYFWPYGRGQGEARKENNIFRTLPDDGTDREGEYLTDRLTEEAMRFVREAMADGKPFFLYFPYYVVHTPLQGKSDLIEHYERKIAAAEGELRHANPVYAAMVHALDDSVGRILKTLEELEADGNTLIIFTSDNGGLTDRAAGEPPFVTSNSPLRQGKGSVYEGGVRVPTIVRWPGLTPPGSVSDEPNITQDFFTTILEATGTPIPEQLAEVLDGVSLVEVLKAPDAKLPERNLYWHYPHYHMGGAIPYSAVRSGDWRLIEFHGERPLELYNLSQDIGEDHNLAEERPELAECLRRDLDGWRVAVGAQLPTVNPDYDPDRPTGWPRGDRIRLPQPVRK